MLRPPKLVFGEKRRQAPIFSLLFFVFAGFALLLFLFFQAVLVECVTGASGKFVRVWVVSLFRTGQYIAYLKKGRSRYANQRNLATEIANRQCIPPVSKHYRVEKL